MDNKQMTTLQDFGWNEAYQSSWDTLMNDNLQPARVIADYGTSLKVVTPYEYQAELSGKLAHYANRQGVPKVGDWVGIQISSNGHAVVELVVPRKSEIARKVAGKRVVKQVIAANVDLAFVLLALDGDFSVERLKRFLYQLSISNVTPIIVLNKADKTEDIQSYISEIESLRIPILVSTATTGDGMNEILSYIKPGCTAILLGSSGVGKSTMTNWLLKKQIQNVQEVRASDATGKHTTVHRQLFMLPNGGLLIDTPGIRELQLWGTEKDLDENFDDISLLETNCKYTTCRHGSEADCAIRAALLNDNLDADHYANYLKMKGELQSLKKKTNISDRWSNKKSFKKVARRDHDIKKDIEEEDE